MENFVHKWEHEGEVYTFSWLGKVDIRPDRVYALAFTQDGEMLLVTNEQWSPAGWLPGGRVEEGETPVHEITERILVRPEAFLGRLFWGNSDPKAKMLFDQAMAIERHLNHRKVFESYVYLAR